MHHNLGTHCYYLSNTSKNWNDSRSYCNNHGADLMIVQSLAEYNFITSVAQALMPTTNWVKNAERIILLITDRNLSSIFHLSRYKHGSVSSLSCHRGVSVKNITGDIQLRMIHLMFLAGLFQWLDGTNITGIESSLLHMVQVTQLVQ